MCNVPQPVVFWCYISISHKYIKRLLGFGHNFNIQRKKKNCTGTTWQAWQTLKWKFQFLYNLLWGNHDCHKWQSASKSSGFNFFFSVELSLQSQTNGQDHSLCTLPYSHVQVMICIIIKYSCDEMQRIWNTYISHRTGCSCACVITSTSCFLATLFQWQKYFTQKIEHALLSHFRPNISGGWIFGAYCYRE